MSKLASIKGYENQLVDMNKPNNLVFNVNGEDILILETNGDIRVKGNLIKNDIEVYYALVELLVRGGHSYKLKQAQERIEELEIANKVLVEVRDNYEVKYKELEAEINQRDNEIKTIRAISNGMLKENEKLKKELDEATEIIKDEICKVWEKGCERREHAEQFLSSLDKPKEEL